VRVTGSHIGPDELVEVLPASLVQGAVDEFEKRADEEDKHHGYQPPVVAATYRKAAKHLRSHVLGEGSDG